MFLFDLMTFSWIFLGKIETDECAPNWTNLDEKCLYNSYEFEKTAKTWEIANEKCSNKNAKLLSIKNLAEQSAIYSE